MIVVVNVYSSYMINANGTSEEEDLERVWNFHQGQLHTGGQVQEDELEVCITCRLDAHT